VNSNRNVIYILRMDNDISDSHLQKLEKYCGAFFHGMTVKIMNEQIDIPSNIGKNEYCIKTRIRKDTGKIQYLAPDILDLITQKYLPNDAY
jgi:hypothetical protein